MAVLDRQGLAWESSGVVRVVFGPSRVFISSVTDPGVKMRYAYPANIRVSEPLVDTIRV
jgi:hypothetical protein